MVADAAAAGVGAGAGEESPAGSWRSAGAAWSRPCANAREAKDEEQGRRRSARPAPAAPLRSNFAETAFWQPQLLTGADGSATIEFTVPDSVTSWNVWVHAVTRDLRGGLGPQARRAASRS